MPYVWFFISVLNVYIFLMYVRDNIYLTHTWWMLKTSFSECISRKLEPGGCEEFGESKTKSEKVIGNTIFLTQRAEARETASSTRTAENFERDRSLASDSSSLLRKKSCSATNSGIFRSYGTATVFKKKCRQPSLCNCTWLNRVLWEHFTDC